MQNSFITLALPFAGRRADATEGAIGQHLGNPVHAEAKGALDATGLLHFMSLTVIRDTRPDGAHLLFEISVDGGPAPALAAIVEALGSRLAIVLDAAGIDPGSTPTADYLLRHNLRLGGGWFDTPGVCFTGSPGFSVRRIRAEHALADRIDGMRDVLEARMTAAEKLRVVRQRLWAEDWKWAFVPEPAPFLAPGKERTLPRVIGVLATALLLYSWPFLAVPLVLWPLVGFWPAIGAALLLYILLIGAALAWLRRLETRDQPDDSPPDAALLASVIRHEDRSAQNLLFAESRMKPGWFRRQTLRFAFIAIEQGVAQIFRPGFLRRIGVIHYARWALIPGTDRLIFWSNFSDSWEAYLEDFIEKATSGLTSVWSNAQGFPRSWFLLGGGAADGDRFRRWARRQQRPVPFWYSGYPDQKLGRIRRNAAIRQGLAMAESDAEAEDWLACFGSEPRPAGALEKREIPTLIFGALKRCRFSEALVLRLPEDPVAGRNWLRTVAPEVTFGETTGKTPVVVLGLSSAGLRRLGVAEADLATFPVAFQHGMAQPDRARALGDAGDQAPAHWLWGEPDTTHAYLLLLDADEARLAERTARHVAVLEQQGGVVAYRRRLKPLPTNGAQVFEPFGYADGISQPILAETPRARLARNSQHVVEAGEMILGYPDNRGYMPPTPSAAPERDPTGMLPALALTPPGERPVFAGGGSQGQRDLGRNGTFLVVRQLDQDVPGFEAFLEAEAERLLTSGTCPWPMDHLPAPQRAKRLADLIGAKMVGRWKDGASLVRYGGLHQHPAERHGRDPDNDFLFSAEDSQGLRCPFGAHIRRANPRDSEAMEGAEQLALSNRHRILRVGRQYEASGRADTPDGQPGLMFMCLNADIERQFEFLQRNWMLNPSFHDVLEERDPLLGRQGGNGRYTIPSRQGPIRLSGLPDFVRMRGGGYFFLPGRRTLAWLSVTA
jgi:deferrochelatase/peroxidase EfeB